MVVIGGLCVLAWAGIGYGAFTHILSTPPVVLEDDFEDASIDTVKWLTYTNGGTSSSVTEPVGGRIISTIQGAVGGSGYMTAGFKSNLTFDISNSPMEFAAKTRAYPKNITDDFAIIWITNGNVNKTGYALWIFKQKVILEKYVGGGNTVLCTVSGLANDWMNWSLVLDNGTNNWRFYLNQSATEGVIADDLKASGSNGPTAAEMNANGGTVVKFNPEMTNLGLASYFDGNPWNLSVRHALVVAPPPVVHSLQGTVAPGNFNGNLEDVALKVELLQGGVVKRVKPLFLNTSGQFVISDIADAGTYDVAIKGSNWLRKVVSGVLINGPTNLPSTVALDCGDLDGDNEITSGDLAIVLANME